MEPHPAHAYNMCTVCIHVYMYTHTHTHVTQVQHYQSNPSAVARDSFKTVCLLGNPAAIDNKGTLLPLPLALRVPAPVPVCEGALIRASVEVLLLSTAEGSHREREARE
jgi:hypothetical protein